MKSVSNHGSVSARNLASQAKTRGLGSSVSGHEFTRANNAANSKWALAPARRFSFWLKAVEAAVLTAAICLSLGATDASSRYNNLNHRLMCTCGCAQLLGECNHVGCPDSGRMLNELRAAIASGLSDQQILDGFAAKYGQTVLAAPSTKGFDLVAWIAPFAVFAAALLGTILLIRRWGGLGGKRQLAAAGDVAADPEERERLERIRRETGSDGGF